MYSFKKITIITGHYGSGKTNIAVNLALYMHSLGQKVAVIDLDIVNPYFRTADFSDLFKENDIRIIAPPYANTNLDIPALSGEVDATIASFDGKIIIDVGGDDAGAIALGRYSKSIASADDYDMLYVINSRRFLTKDGSEAAELLLEIEQSSRLKATGIINNTNLGEQTTKELVENSSEYAKEVARLTNLPIAFTCAKKSLAGKTDFPVDIFVKSAWQ